MSRCSFPAGRRFRPTRTAVLVVFTLLSTLLMPVSATAVAESGRPRAPDSTRVAEAAEALVIPDADDVRGNITLPTTGLHDSEVSWKSTKDRVVTPTGEVHRPEHGAEPVAVRLTATVRLDGRQAKRRFELTVPPLPEKQQYAGYLFSYFTGEGHADGEQVYFGASRGDDPLHWDELNGGEPVLRSTKGEGGVRDPFIIRSPEGDKFYLIATDLRMHGDGDWDRAQRHGSKHIEVWESTDLVNWSEQRHVRVAGDNAGNTWAPEAYYDHSIGAYVVFWASKLYAEDDPDHTGDSYNRMMYAVTRDFHTFSEPKVWVDPGHSVIDSTVIREDGTYYRFTKDERGNTPGSPCGKFIVEEKSPELRSTDYEPVADCIGRGDAENPGLSRGEGPTVFKSNTEDKWYLFIDEFGGRGYVPFETTDLDSGEWTMSQDYDLPDRPRHGTVLPVTAEELQRLRGVPKALETTDDGLVTSYEFDGTGSTVTDVTGHGYDGRIHGEVSRRAGHLEFAGTNGYVELPDNLMHGLDEITVAAEVWIDPGQPEPYFLWGLGNAREGVGREYLFTTGDEYRTSITTSGWRGEQTVRGRDLSRGGWHQITYTLGDGTARLYADGVQVARRTDITLTPGDIGAGRTTDNYLGRSLFDADHHLDGRMRSFSLWDRALDAEEVLDLRGNETAIGGVELDSLKVDPIIDPDAKTIVLPVEPGTDRRKLRPSFALPERATLRPGNGSTQDFTEPVTYRVRGADHGESRWTVRAVEMNSPSLPGYNADPNIVRFGDTYYIYATTDGFAGWGSDSFKTWSSTDLVHWTEHDTILDLTTDVTWADERAWAPAAIEKNGRYYFYFSADRQIGVAVSDSPTGPFVDSGDPLVAANPDGGGQAIDPAVFTDHDGQSYLYWGNTEAYVVPLNDDMVSFDPSRVKRLRGLDGFREGLFMHERDGTYYLSWSIDDTRSENYRVGYATGTNPMMDGLTNHGRILTKDPSRGIYGTGHHSVIQAPETGEWYIAYHRHAVPDGDGTHREVTIDRLRHTQDGRIAPVVPTLTGIDPV